MKRVSCTVWLLASAVVYSTAAPAWAQKAYQDSPGGDFTHMVGTSHGPVYFADAKVDGGWNADAEDAIKQCNKAKFDKDVATLRAFIPYYDGNYNGDIRTVEGLRKDDLGELADKAERKAQDALQDANTIASLINWLTTQKIDWAACYEALKKKYNDTYKPIPATRELTRVTLSGGFLGGGTIINSNDTKTTTGTTKTTTGGTATGGSTGQINEANNPFKDLPPDFTDHILDKQKAETPAPKPVPSPTPTPKTMPVTIGIRSQPTLPSPKVALEAIIHPTTPITPTFATLGAAKPTPLSPVAAKPPLTLQIPGKSVTPAASPCPPGQKAVVAGSRPICVNAAAAAAAVAAGAH